MQFQPAPNKNFCSTPTPPTHRQLKQCFTILSLNSIPIPYNRTTPQINKTNSPHVKKTINTTTISPIISRHLTYFRREAPSFMFDRILNVSLSNNVQSYKKVYGGFHHWCWESCIPHTSLFS